MKNRTALFALIASTLVASSCQSTHVERGPGQEDVAGASSDTYRAQRERVYIAEIEEHIRAGRTESARRLLSQLPDAKTDPAALMLLAESFVSDGDLDSARATLVEAEALEGSPRGVTRLTAVIEELAGNWDAAGIAYLRAAEEDPNDTSLLVGHARTLLVQGELVEAAAYLERETAFHPNAADLAVAAADACMALFRYRDAVGHYTRASVLIPSDSHVAEGMVLAFALGGYHSAALSRAEHMDLSAASSTVHLVLGRSALVEGRAELAIGHLGTYLDLQETDAPAWLDLARANYMLDRQDASLSALQHVLAHGRPTVAAMTLLGHVRYRAGQYDLALGSYRKALELGGDSIFLKSMIDKLQERLDASAEVSRPLGFIEE